ncbi:SMODS domain-containing nucleotidyltransferase [Psychromonas antarctica]|uniref:SMODS domain-containing nucleotidyltransferase n=1 Tax=Psychromonas antarctica TaxID=67573 RepID=UPI001EE928AC|nr:hypothetical protein [Psychromonas antarctica]MCG6202458.1 hypothetical protein [Psychromonas antarctica]
MKHVKIFNNFMKDTVNLNETRLNKMQIASSAVVKVVKESSSFSDLYIEDSPQGSYGHRTIIKPLPAKEFDADIVIFLNKHDDWEAKDYIKELYSIFKNNPIYKDKVHYNTRCICLDYAGDFHVDVVPCIVTSKYFFLEEKNYFVCNRATNEFEETDPEAYKKWIKDKNAVVKNNNLIKSIRLFKYLRDVKKTFSCKSILLTTLISNSVQNIFDALSDDFKDLPTSFKTLIDRLDLYLQANATMPQIENPVQPSETFTRHWDELKYQNFRSFIHKYKGWVDDAFDEPDRELSIKKWRKIFGGNFHAVVMKSESSISNESNCLDSLLNESCTYISIPSHCIPHKWIEADPVQDITVNVHYKDQTRTQFINKLIFGSTVPKKYNVKFEIANSLPEDSQIYWQVTNTGSEAGLANQLRGTFIEGEAVREESTSYKGNHFVEAFVVKSGYLLARSGKVIISIGN